MLGHVPVLSYFNGTNVFVCMYICTLTPPRGKRPNATKKFGGLESQGVITIFFFFKICLRSRFLFFLGGGGECNVNTTNHHVLIDKKLRGQIWFIPKVTWFIPNTRG